jgi:hypothetical protein
MSLREHTWLELGLIEPCLPFPAKVPPSGPGWVHEFKHDGTRSENGSQIVAAIVLAGIILYELRAAIIALTTELGNHLKYLSVMRHFADGLSRTGGWSVFSPIARILALLHSAVALSALC